MKVARKIGLAIIILAIVGCAVTTKPNPIYQGPFPEDFTTLDKKNPLLAMEIKKLPEIRDGISPSERSAIENLIKVYSNNPETFDSVFNKMYQVGIPEIRKYCTPLQALFWLSEDGRLSQDNSLLLKYSLEKILEKAWKFSCEVVFSKDQIEVILEGIQDAKEREKYVEYLQNNKMNYFRGSLLYYYKTKPEIFSVKAKREIKRAVKSSKNSRWESFDTVIERLNAPELVDYYEKNRFSWGTGYGYNGNARIVFKENQGNCIYITAFTIHCLRKAGYKAREKRVASSSVQFPFHAVCEFEANGRKFIMDNGRPDKRGIVPYEEY